MKGLDLSKFKKIDSNDSVTIMQHPDGHQIKIAHDKLKGDMRKQLQDLPQFDAGGMVESGDNRYNREDPNLQHGKNKKRHQSEASANVIGVKPAQSEYKEKEHEKALNEMPKMADGGEVEDIMIPVPAEGLSSTSMPPAAEPVSTLAGEAPIVPGLESQVPRESAMNVPLNIPQQPKQQIMPPVNPSDAILKAQQEQEAGIKSEASAASMLGRNEAAIAQQQVRQQEQLMQNFQQQSASIQNEIKAAVQDYNNGHIDPKRFWTSKSDLGKVSTAIGLILGGIGSGLTRGPNVALEFLNRQIDRDIDAQRMEMGKKQNVLSAMQQQFGNLKDATMATKLMYADLYTTKLQQAAAASKDPMAQARAQQAIGEIHAKTAPMLAELGMRQAVFQGQRAGQVSAAQAIPVLVPEAQRAKALDEVRDSEIRNQTVQSLKKSMDSVAKLQSVGARAGSPLQSSSQIDAHNLAVQSLTKEMFGGLSDNELELVKHGALVRLTDSPQTVKMKTDKLINMIMKHQSTPTLDAYGISAPAKPFTSFTPRK